MSQSKRATKHHCPKPGTMGHKKPDLQTGITKRHISHSGAYIPMGLQATLLHQFSGGDLTIVETEIIVGGQLRKIKLASAYIPLHQNRCAMTLPWQNHTDQSV